MVHYHVVTTIDNSIEALRVHLPMKGEYTMIDLTMKLVGITHTISGKMRADEDVPKSESVSFFLDIDFGDCTLADVIQYASADRKIAWAASGRKVIGTIKSGQHIKVKASSPGVRVIDAKVQLRAEVEGMSDEEATAYLLAKVRELRS